MKNLKEYVIFARFFWYIAEANRYAENARFMSQLQSLFIQKGRDRLNTVYELGAKLTDPKLQDIAGKLFHICAHKLY